MKKLLFVCTGNTCRSPMAEGLFGLFLKNKGIDNIEVTSAGIAAFTGEEVSLNAVKAVKDLGGDISAHRARRLSQYDIDEADLIVCMTQSHCNFLQGLTDKDKLFLPKNQISDPFGGSLEDYKYSADTIMQAFNDILNTLEGFQILPMTKDQLDDVFLIESQTFSVPWSKSAFLSELGRETSRLFVAMLGDKLVGYVSINNILGEVHINNIAVKKEYRRRSIAKNLILHALDVSQEMGADLITLEVRESNKAAYKLYESLGFVNLGKRRDYYTNPREDAYIMTKFLNEKGEAHEDTGD